MGICLCRKRSQAHRDFRSNQIMCVNPFTPGRPRANITGRQMRLPAGIEVRDRGRRQSRPSISAAGGRPRLPESSSRIGLPDDSHLSGCRATCPAGFGIARDCQRGIGRVRESWQVHSIKRCWLNRRGRRFNRTAGALRLWANHGRTRSVSSWGPFQRMTPLRRGK